MDKTVNAFTFCYISSESAIKGSYDDTYHISKCSVDRFIKEYYLNSSNSRIFSIAPSTIDSGMTKRRSDLDRIAKYKKIHRKKRFISAPEFAKIIHILFSNDFDYLSNTVVEINGGKFARNKY
ncbi:MAG: SDR family oxidoreductase [Bacteroidetes bacterium]|nr:SDR family oxidoreductase [Bacteroidota bacterium]